MADISVIESEINTDEQNSNNYFKVEKQIFFQGTPIYTKKDVADELLITKQLKAGQGSGVVADENTHLYSDRIANCFALILENEKSKKAALFHIDANSPRGVNVEILNQISEGGGVVVMQAIRGSQSIPSEATKNMFSEHILANVLITDDIQIETGSNFWDITYFPNKHEFRVHQDETDNTSWYIEQPKLSPVPEMTSLTNKEKLVSFIVNDQNIYHYLRQPNNPSPNKVLGSINTLATFVSKDRSVWVNRWILSSKEEKQIMANQIAQNLNSK